MDGRFVPNITIGPLVVDALRPITDKVLDCHLMIVEPEQRVADFAKVRIPSRAPSAPRARRLVAWLHTGTTSLHSARSPPVHPQAGADIISVHAEQTSTIHLHRVVYQIKDLGCLAGVVLNPATPLSAIEEVITDVDLVLIMSVNPGFGGQKFIESQVEKIRKLKAMCQAKARVQRMEGWGIGRAAVPHHRMG